MRLNTPNMENMRIADKIFLHLVSNFENGIDYKPTELSIIYCQKKKKKKKKPSMNIRVSTNRSFYPAKYLLHHFNMI